MGERSLTQEGGGRLPGGRPRFEYTEERLDTIKELAAEGATIEELAHAVGCADSTFRANKKAMEAYRWGVQESKLSLRHWQFLQAKSGNVQMLIWLGKNMLGQADNVKNEDNKAVEKLDSLLKEFQDAVKR